MPEYQVTVKVDQIVTKEIRAQVVASSSDEAEAKVREAVQQYPDKVTVDGIRRMVTAKSHYWIPRTVDFESITEIKPKDPPKGAA